jgi:hypothetical protein
MSQQFSLREAVLEVMGNGERDPIKIAARLSEFYGEKWMLRQFVNVIAILVAEHQGTGGRRLEAVPPRQSGLPRIQRAGGDFYESARWVNVEIGWRRVADLTEADCREVAAQYDLLATVASRHSAWFVEVADRLRDEGALTLGEIRGLLPIPPMVSKPLELARADHGSDDA